MMIIGTGTGLFPSVASPAAQAAGGQDFSAQSPAAAEAGMAVGAIGAAPQEGGGVSAQTAEDRAYAKMMQDKFNQECQTCKNRKYTDGSNDMGVSFKTPTHISPEASFSAVSSHEQEHVTRNKAAAEAEGGEVLSSRVVLHGDICPECGRYYIAGGTTYTTTRSGGEQDRQQPSDPHGHSVGKDMNATA